MIRKIMLSILLFLGFSLITFGVVFSVKSYSKRVSNQSSLPENNSSELSTDEINEIYEKEYNDSEKIAEEHCLNELCISKTIISYEYNAYGVMSAQVVNRSDGVIDPGFINLNFSVDGQTKVLYFYYPALDSNASMPLELQFTDSAILKADDYSMSLPSEDEIDYYKSLFY